MASINWPTRVINVPKADMMLIQTTPIEVRELNINTFRLALKDLEDDEEGQPWATTHNHNPPVAVGGIELARVVEIINGYTVTFENEAYIVNMIGANSNIADKVNPNNVSIRSANSAGLLQSRELEHAAFGNGVTLNITTGTAGTLYPIGTSANPSNNLADALMIASARGLTKLFVGASMTIPNTASVAEFSMIGIGHHTRLTFTAGANTSHTQFEDVEIEGTLSGHIKCVKAEIGTATINHGDFFDCGFFGTLSLGNGGTTTLFNCYDMGSAATEFVIDLAASQQELVIRSFRGTVEVTNKTSAASATVELMPGKLILGATVTTGEVLVRGIGAYVNNGATASVNIESLQNTAAISDAVWDEAIADHLTAGTTGKALSDAGGAGNPWGTPIIGNTDAGTFGELAGKKLLTVGKFLGLK